MSKRQQVIGGLKSILSRTKEEFKSSGVELRSEVKDFYFTVTKRANAQRNKEAAASAAHVNYNICGPILGHFQEQWAEIHENTTENSVLATSLDRKLQELAKMIKERHKTVEDFYKEFRGLKALINSVEKAKQSVEDIGTAIDKVEQSLHELEQNCAQLDNARKKGAMRVRYEEDIQSKEDEVAKLQRKIDARRSIIESREEEMMIGSSRERQQAFQDIFNQQVSEYKSKGHLDRPISIDTEMSVDLRDIEIEDVDGRLSLSEFLSDVTSGEEELYSATTDSMLSPDSDIFAHTSGQTKVKEGDS